MKYINLTQGYKTMVDDEDYYYLIEKKWYAGIKKSGAVYAVRTATHSELAEGAKHRILMHRIILNPPCGFDIDHINMDTLDNRRSNLRVCSRMQNSYNVGKHKDNKSGYKGVYRCNNRNGWIAYIRYNGQPKYLGYFASREDAAKAYNEASIKFHKNFSYLHGKDMNNK